MPDTPAERDTGPHSPSGWEWRVSRLEDDMRDIKAILAQIVPLIVRIDATITARLPHLATKAELADVRSELLKETGAIRAELAEKPSRAYLWGVLAVLVTAYGAGLAAIAVLK
jgi:hypothetical protein